LRDISDFTELLSILFVTPDQVGWKEFIGFMKEANSEFTPPLFDRAEFVYQLENRLNNRALVAVDMNNKIVTASMYQTDYCGDTDSAYLTFFRVAPKHRKLGIGFWFRQLLLDHLKAEGFKSVVTRTWSSNTEMIRLIEKTGFSSTKIIKNDRGPDIDTIYFKREL